jgi:hypothetical protein
MKLIGIIFLLCVGFVAGHIYGDKAKDEVATILSNTQTQGQSQ